MLTIRSRRDLSLLLEKQMTAASARSGAPSIDDDIEGRTALKVYLLEAHGRMRSDPLGALQEVAGGHGISVAATDDPGLYERVGATPARPRTVATMAGVPVFPLRQTRFARDIGLVEAKADERAARSMPPAGEFPAEDETLVDTTNAPAPADTVAKTG